MTFHLIKTKMEEEIRYTGWYVPDKFRIEDPRYYTRQKLALILKPFKQKVTDDRLLEKFDDLGSVKSKEILVTLLKSTKLPKAVKKYYLRKITATFDSLKIAELILTFTLGISKGLYFKCRCVDGCAKCLIDMESNV